MKIRTKLIMDAIMFVLLYISMKYYFTGGLLHEILGTLLIFGFLFHIIMNRKYYIVMLRKLKANAKLSTKNKLSFAINILLLLATVVMAISSIAISQDLFTFLNASVSSYSLWRTLHIGCAVLMLACVFVHICMHAGMIQSAIRKLWHSDRTQRLGNAGVRIVAFAMAILVAKASYENALLIVDDYEKVDAGTSDMVVVDESATSDTDGSSVTSSNKATNSQYVEIGRTQNDENAVIESEETVSSSDEDVPTLDDYLSGLRCNACGKHCSLLSPRCGRGNSQAEQATQEYYELYS